MMRATIDERTNALQQPAEKPHVNSVRQLVESLVCLAIAVMLFRSFEVEGYIISTGSMAPSLLGYHKRVVCPACQFAFAYGVAYEPQFTGTNSGDGSRSQTLVHCPNCGQDSIDITDVPRNQGDQLLVHKHAFLFRSPRRWETIVFRNPGKPTQAYVKRVVGLPGERVQIVHGDLHIDGKIARKNWTEVRDIRIPVDDLRHRPQPKQDGEWQPRWVGHVNWQSFSDGFIYTPPAADLVDRETRETLAWLNYRHWVRARGNHTTVVPLAVLPDSVELEVSPFPTVRYNSATQQLIAQGVVSPSLRDRLIGMADAPDYQAAVELLARRSHFAPITDQYGYNRVDGMVAPMPVFDFVLETELILEAGNGRFVVELTNGKEIAQCIFDLQMRRVLLQIDDNATAIRSAPLPEEFIGRPIAFEMSNVDRQIMVAVDGVELFSPYLLESQEVSSHPVVRPVRLGAKKLKVTVQKMQLYRDVHYTRGSSGHGVDVPYQLGDDEYFFLGDNSPVSLDSRGWEQPGVSQRLFLGKPFLVHLPSRPGRIQFRGYDKYFRVPDFSRIRYIH